ncbi:uncharacterized protein PAC_15930 [Phialocephala subalpina]|uniref:Protein kinase domain-containing protein n=1 Tax=Phialocephala subalpina TaxID=576137 RepID=A0A1L7XLU6_9HELO|nr:uncharacterized protein PAC_15930 [Phialocephala subalpina]
MRLLEIKNRGEFKFTKNLVEDIPPYAILSHTWGEDDDEVTFQDLMQSAGENKTGYRKIQFCEKQAAKDGLKYIWIDTCCIDKSNSTELGEAIISMFHWYGKANKCYVYLPDVSAHGSEWKSAFRKSRWFTRGWTLQELIAPSSVEFFSKEGEQLGDKISLGQEIYEITGVPIGALQGEPLSLFSISERVSWARNRETKRAEDGAYSLTGIFGIYMSPMYGEGKDGAFDDRTSTGQDEQTVFDLIPRDENTLKIARDELNSRRVKRDPDGNQFLRIGFRPRSKQPGLLVKFGRIFETNDIILRSGWSRQDQCSFDLNRETGELLLHDLSTRQNTQLIDFKTGAVQIRKYPRQCVVLLDREWILVMGYAEFHLKPRKAQDPEAFAEERLSFARQPIPNEYEGTYEEKYEGTLQQLRAADLESLASGYNTRMNTPFQPELGNEIRYTKLKYLGGGSQGSVYKVVDMHTGAHYACKIIQHKRIMGLGIAEKDFKLKIEAQVALLKHLHHDHILKYECSQGWDIDQEINIFQPLCEENFGQRIWNLKSQEERQAATKTMFHDITLGLHYIHTHDPIIIHRDLKPSNILYCRGKYLLGDFGIATTVDNSHSLAGTKYYMAPELWERGDQTTKVDIYGLGAAIIEGLGEFPDLALRPTAWRSWHHFLQNCVKGKSIAPMLADSPDKRPTADQIICTFFPDPLSLATWTQKKPTKLSPQITRPALRKGTNSKRPIVHTKVVKPGVPPQNRYRTRSQSVGALNQTLPNKRKRKTEERLTKMEMRRRIVAAERILGTGEAEAGAGTSNGYHDAKCPNAEGSCTGTGH